MILSQYKSIYFLGIGGIGMSALAEYFLLQNFNVGGYDKTPSDITKKLEQKGAFIVFEETVDAIPKNFLTQNTLIVYTPAIPPSHPQKIHFTSSGFVLKKRSEILGLITNQTYSFAVAGTHGKTTTTAILGHILYQSNLDVTAFVGGVLEQYQTNLLSRGNQISVLEADEFDRSFLHLEPNMACITSTDADHLDIYGNASEVKRTFDEFAKKITDKTHLFVNETIQIDGQKVGFSDDADYQIKNITIQDNTQTFDFKTPDETYNHLNFSLPGKHNLLNASMAAAMALSYGVSIDHVKNGLKTFPGVKRRFSYPIKTNNFVMIDDYAHHPTEIEAIYETLNLWYPKQQKTVVFQPHLFSRTQDFMHDFAIILSKFDQVILLPIYPARELPIAGVTSEALLELISIKHKSVCSKQELLEKANLTENQVLVVLGAGDIGEMVEPISQKIKQIIAS